MCQVWAKMWSKIKANILLMGMKVDIATLKSNQVSHQKNAKQNRTRYHSVHIRLETILKSYNTKCWQAGGKVHTVYACYIANPKDHSEEHFGNRQ